MPLLWTAASFVLLAAINPEMRQGVGWPSFVFSQFLFGLVAASVVVRHKLARPWPAPSAASSAEC